LRKRRRKKISQGKKGGGAFGNSTSLPSCANSESQKKEKKRKGLADHDNGGGEKIKHEGIKYIRPHRATMKREGEKSRRKAREEEKTLLKKVLFLSCMGLAEKKEKHCLIITTERKI